MDRGGWSGAGLHRDRSGSKLDDDEEREATRRVEVVLRIGRYVYVSSRFEGVTLIVGVDACNIASEAHDDRAELQHRAPPSSRACQRPAVVYSPSIAMRRRVAAVSKLRSADAIVPSVPS